MGESCFHFHIKVYISLFFHLQTWPFTFGSRNLNPDEASKTSAEEEEEEEEAEEAEEDIQ